MSPASSSPSPTALDLAVVGAGPVGLALALHAARSLPRLRVTLYDAREPARDVSGDARTLALSLGSVQLLQRLGCWPSADAQPIREVYVSQQPPSGLPIGPHSLREPEVRIRAIEEAVPMLGAVLRYGQIVAPLQNAWLAEEAASGGRLRTRFGVPVASLQPAADGAGVDVEAGGVERFDLAVVAEGGVFADQARKAVRHDYQQTAWVGTVGLDGGTPGLAVERFTRHGPAALLPLPDGRAALVWCVPTGDDPVHDLTPEQRVAVLNTVFPPDVGQIVDISPLKAFPLGLNAERTLVQGRSGSIKAWWPGSGRVVRIGNAAQTLHPVAGQGLNLGLRDVFALVFALQHAPSIDAALRRVEWSRAPDRWSMIAVTDFLARSFTWQWPGLAAARGLGLAALQRVGPARSLLARRMMFGSR